MNLKPMINGIAAAAEANVKTQLRDDDYIGEDGFLHCGLCGKARQAKQYMFGEEQLVWCICDCRDKDLKAQEEARTREKIEMLRKNGFNDPTLAESTFEADDSPDSQESVICRNYVKNFDYFYEKGKGLLFYGGVGRGKTFYASCIANALIEKLHPVLVTSIGRFVRGMENDFGGRNEQIDYLDRFALVVFDDLGVERNTDYMNEQVYALIDGRVRSGKPMIITTNVTIDVLKNPGNIAYERIYDRVVANCIPVKFDGANVRRAKARNDYADDMKLLRGEGSF